MKNKLDRVNKKLTLLKNSINAPENIVMELSKMTHTEKKSPLISTRMEISVSELWDNFKLPDMYAFSPREKEIMMLDRKIFEKIIFESKVFQTEYTLQIHRLKE